MDVTLRGDSHDVGVLRVDEHRWDLFRVVEAEVLPRAAGVGGFVDAIALSDPPAGDQVAHADVDDVRVGRGHGDGADRRGFFDRVEDGVPGLAGARRFPDPAHGEADVEDSELARSDGAGHGGHASGAEGTEVAPGEAVEERGVDGATAMAPTDEASL